MIEGFQFCGQVTTCFGIKVIVRVGKFFIGYNEAIFPEPSKMLGNGGFSEGDISSDILEGRFSEFEEVMEDDDACRVGERFGPK